MAVILAIGMTLAFIPPAQAAPDWDDAYWSPDSSVRCPKGKFGYFYLEGNHVSHKIFYWKTRRATHWSNSELTGFNGAGRLVRVLGKRGGGRQGRAYFAAVPSSRHGMSPLRNLNTYTFCDRRNLMAHPWMAVEKMEERLGLWKDAAKVWQMVRMR